jgi:uncharacterized protein
MGSRSQARWKIPGAVLAGALAVGALVASGWAPASAGPIGQVSVADRTITVSGEGEATAQPDVAYVSIGVQTQGQTAAEASAENSRRMTAVLEVLRARGLGSRELQTSGLNVTPQFQRDRPDQVTGYQATNNLTATVNDVERAGELLDAALGAGANRIGGLRFGIRDTAALRQQALAEATQTARGRADVLAGSLGLRIIGVHSVAEEGVVVPRPVAMAMDATPRAAAAPAPPPPVEAGELRVTARVRVTFSFE